MAKEAAMTDNAQIVDEFADMQPEDMGRWSGYGRQSWQERFAELDRRYRALAGNSVQLATRTAEKFQSLSAEIETLTRQLDEAREGLRTIAKDKKHRLTNRQFKWAQDIASNALGGSHEA